ncbi:hypothetical protein AUEXF2481DRAFT_163482 [Aureobasidium subglaciale EXF-2481]|uniref:Uncharacterized protein n=1 Tax=Aureobasidium subglaciale (strain EXF-2481) TaxID=1043005 RepID=A0A074Z3H5_AURSE|nr:uncharacterized protein AUEXF2481DRAFT_163482 [Aureobasidium subglaciale EXF-2481]KER00858.1 hypothetical protein AUEXF2481DRAFT_163482 [Aureobasidium subglaciale EXF-2481]
MSTETCSSFSTPCQIWLLRSNSLNCRSPRSLRVAPIKLPLRSPQCKIPARPLTKRSFPSISISTKALTLLPAFSSAQSVSQQRRSPYPPMSLPCSVSRLNLHQNRPTQLPLPLSPASKTCQTSRSSLSTTAPLRKQGRCFLWTIPVSTTPHTPETIKRQKRQKQQENHKQQTPKKMESQSHQKIEMQQTNDTTTQRHQ